MLLLRLRKECCFPRFFCVDRVQFVEEQLQEGPPSPANALFYPSFPANILNIARLSQAEGERAEFALEFAYGSLVFSLFPL